MHNILHATTIRSGRTQEGRGATGRIRRVLLAAAVGSALAATAVIGATPGTSSASTLNGVATIASPGTTTPLTQGGSLDQFTVSLPALAACTGDTATGGYHVYSYLVPQGTTLSTVTFGSHPSTGHGFYVSSGKYYGPVNTAANTGDIIGIPNNFEWAPLVTNAGVTLAQLLYTGSGTTASGVWEAGLACANSSGTLTDNWNVPVTFHASATDTNGFTWTVVPSGDSAPAITSASSTTFDEGAAGSFTVTATGTPTPVIGETGSLPSGVTLTSAGVLAGTPAQSGAFPITLTATNGIGSPATQSFTLTVLSAGFQITTPVTLNSGQPGIPYASETFAASGAGPGATFKWKGSGFPKKLKLSKGGILAGTVSPKVAPGVFHPSVTVTETYITHNGKKKVKNTFTATKTFSLTIA